MISFDINTKQRGVNIHFYAEAETIADAAAMVKALVAEWTPTYVLNTRPVTEADLN